MVRINEARKNLRDKQKSKNNKYYGSAKHIRQQQYITKPKSNPKYKQQCTRKQTQDD